MVLYCRRAGREGCLGGIQAESLFHLEEVCTCVHVLCVCAHALTAYFALSNHLVQRAMCDVMCECV